MCRSRVLGPHWFSHVFLREMLEEESGVETLIVANHLTRGVMSVHFLDVEICN